MRLHYILPRDCVVPDHVTVNQRGTIVYDPGNNWCMDSVVDDWLWRATTGSIVFRERNEDILIAL